MAPKNLKSLGFMLMIVLTMVLTGCGGASPIAGAPPVVNGVDLARLLAEAGNYWKQGKVKETNTTTLYRTYLTSDSNMRLGVSDLVANNRECFKNVANTQAAISAAAVGNVNETAIVSSLALNGDISGDAATSKCSQASLQIADYITSNRAGVQNAYLSFFTAAQDYNLFVSSSPEIDFMNDLMKTYGDTTKVYEWLKSNGIGVSDWSWLPTDALTVTTGDKGLCDSYMTGAFITYLPRSVQTMYTGHTDSLMSLYEAAWDPTAYNGAGTCTLNRMAALKYMMRDLSAGQTKQNIVNGEDTGAFPTEVPLATATNKPQ